MSDSAPVTVWITRTVKPGCEAAFEQALHHFAQESLRQPGQLGVHITRPAPGSDSRDYRIMRKFTSREALRAFRASPEYLEWIRSIHDFTEGEPRLEELSGLESWFTPAGAELHPLPKWKMAVVTFGAVYPLTVVLPPLLERLITPAPPFVINLVMTVVMVVSLTWALMPLLTRLLQGWLNPSKT